MTILNNLRQGAPRNPEEFLKSSYWIGTGLMGVGVLAYACGGLVYDFGGEEYENIAHMMIEYGHVSVASGFGALLAALGIQFVEGPSLEQKVDGDTKL